MNYLKDKTRVLVTHKFESLNYVDYIYIFKKGKIVEEGTLEELRNSATFQEVEEKYKMTDNQVEEEKQDQTSPNLRENQKVEQPETSNADPQITLVTEQTNPNPVIAKERQDLQQIPEDDEKILHEKLMLDEDREVGVIGFGVLKSYFHYYGGWFYFFLVFLGIDFPFVFLISISYVYLDISTNWFKLLAFLLE